MLQTTRRSMLQTGAMLMAGTGLTAAWKPEAWAEKLETDAGELPSKDEFTHLLSRITFGFSAADFELARSMGYDAYVDWQLDFEAIGDSAVEAVLADRLPTQSMSLEQILALAQDREQRRTAFREMQVATLYRAIFSRRQLYEVMVEFWNNHFAVNAAGGVLAILKPYEDRAVMRAHALGNFRQLLRADAESPAMLYFLDNISNVKDGPNENYARELMELHTLGVDGGYTEKDVQEAARILTGWAFRRRTGDFRFIGFRHDYWAKEVMGVRFPAGRGVSEGRKLLDMLARHPSTARLIAGKLARRFISDNPPESVVENVADAFSRTGGDIRTTLRTLLLSDEFRAAGDQKLKRPFEFVVSTLRAVGPEVSRRGYRSLFETLRRLAHLPLTWPAPNGFPDVAGYWISTAALLNRWNFALGLADGTLDRLFHVRIYSLLGLAKTPAEIVDTLVGKVLNREMRLEDREALVEYAAGGEPTGVPLTGRRRIETARGVLGLILVSRYFNQR